MNDKIIAAGVYLKTCRQSAGLTQSEVSDPLGFCNQGVISAIELGKRTFPAECITAFSTVCGMDPAEIAGELLVFYHPVYAEHLIKTKYEMAVSEYGWKPE